ncbi:MULTISPECIES: hypothetical protein [Alistipes]|uniref:hypothetical protein n=1 Tax=Alistipes TaxID=239759 RepID=UPI001B3A2B28|nr:MULTISPECIES: hypothetical protein [Alistipes]MBQ4904110.1 hypothetical protein [Alistipes sp. Marseille-P2263]MCI2259442.1 hypothetical protein [Alistipes dispar]
MGDFDLLIGFLFIVWAIFGVLIGLYATFVMAEKYGRFGPTWLTVALCFSPIIAIIWLAALGKTPEKEFKDWKTMELQKRKFLKDLEEN